MDRYRRFRDILAVLVVLASAAQVTAAAATRTAQAPNGQHRVKRLTEKEREIARAIASGTPIKVIIAKLAKGGMTTDALISAMIRAGADPSAVVYEAVVERLSTRTVVSAALQAGVAVRFVVNAAMSAGADQRLVFLGAHDAGLSPGAIAAAVASNSGPAARTTDTVIATDAPVLPAAARNPFFSFPIPIGGGGGAAPSTRVASPYRP